jgi:hypothetical protein
MTSSASNIEAVARDICSKQLSRHTPTVVRALLLTLISTGTV